MSDIDPADPLQNQDPRLPRPGTEPSRLQDGSVNDVRLRNIDVINLCHTMIDAIMAARENISELPEEARVTHDVWLDILRTAGSDPALSMASLATIFKQRREERVRLWKILKAAAAAAHAPTTGYPKDKVPKNAGFGLVDPNTRAVRAPPRARKGASASTTVAAVGFQSAGTLDLAPPGSEGSKNDEVEKEKAAEAAKKGGKGREVHEEMEPENDQARPPEAPPADARPTGGRQTRSRGTKKLTNQEHRSDKGIEEDREPNGDQSNSANKAARKSKFVVTEAIAQWGSDFKDRWDSADKATKDALKVRLNKVVQRRNITEGTVGWWVLAAEDYNTLFPGSDMPYTSLKNHFKRKGYPKDQKTEEEGKGETDGVDSAGSDGSKTRTDVANPSGSRKRSRDAEKELLEEEDAILEAATTPNTTSERIRRGRQADALPQQPPPVAGAWRIKRVRTGASMEEESIPMREDSSPSSHAGIDEEMLEVPNGTAEETRELVNVAARSHTGNDQASSRERSSATGKESVPS